MSYQILYDCHSAILSPGCTGYQQWASPAIGITAGHQSQGIMRRAPGTSNTGQQTAGTSGQWDQAPVGSRQHQTRPSRHHQEPLPSTKHLQAPITTSSGQLVTGTTRNNAPPSAPGTTRHWHRASLGTDLPFQAPPGTDHPFWAPRTRHL